MSSARPGLNPSKRPITKMEDSVTPLSVLGPQCEAQRERIRKLFESGASAQETLRQLCELADETIRKVFGELQRVRDAGTGPARARRLRPRSALPLLGPGSVVFVRQRKKRGRIAAAHFGIFPYLVGLGIPGEFRRTYLRR